MQGVLNKTKTFLEMIKFEHSIFALPFAYLGLVLAENGWPRPRIFWGVTLVMVTFRTMAMGLNRIIDVPVDAANPRTQSRALPAGKLKVSFVWVATVLSFLIFEAATFKLSRLCFYLSPVVVFLAALYPFTKRFTFFSHFVLGIILGIAPYGAWLAAGREFSWVPGLITIGVTAWVAGFDMIYALQDVDFDRKAGLYSVPAYFGPQTALVLTQVLHLVTLIAWWGAGKMAGLDVAYQIGLTIVACFLFREHLLVHEHGLKRLEEAFFTMNAVVSVSIFIFAALDISLRSFS